MDSSGKIHIWIEIWIQNFPWSDGKQNTANVLVDFCFKGWQEINSYKTIASDVGIVYSWLINLQWSDYVSVQNIAKDVTYKNN